MKTINRRKLLKMAGSTVVALYVPPKDGISISWNFEGGSLAKVDQIDATHFQCHVNGQVDQNGRNRQASWYYFRVDHAKERLVTFDLVDLSGEYNYIANSGAITKDTLPFYSSDGHTWIPIEQANYDPKGPTLSYQVQTPSDRFWIAHVPPYTLENFEKLSQDLKHCPDAKMEAIGKSVEGRTIPLVTITDNSVPDKAKKVIWLMFRQHAWEAGSSWTAEGLLRFAISTDPIARQIRRGAILKILPLCDPDGVVHGTVRFNKYGYDLNRNWDLVDPVKMPEIASERRAILDWVDAGQPIDFFLTLHNDENNEYLYGPPDPKWLPLLKRVWQNWKAGATFAPTDQPVLVDSSTTEGKPGRMNVVQGLSHDRGLPAFEVEMRISKHPKLGRRPNVEDRLSSGKELIQAIWKGLSASN